jgi:glycosyltransferase involved in cell wall biosynthesis
MPFFSVIIPLYNKENYITDTLNSVLAQTFTDFEIIVVNDTSTDNSLAVAQTVKDDRIRFIEHPVNKGLSASRNTGIKNASSDYVAFLDADDLWKPQFLEKIFLLINQYPECSIYGTRYEEIYPGNLVLDIGVSLENLNDKMGMINFFSTGLNKPAFCSSCLCLKTEVFSKSGYYDENITFGEDIDFYIRINYDFKLAYYNESLASYLIYYQNQMTGIGLKNKKIPDFDKYEVLTANRPDIKRYLDFQRYIIAKTYRLDGDITNYKRIKSGISMSSLNYKQRFLLIAPLFIIKLITLFKKKLLQKGVVVNSYS